MCLLFGFRHGSPLFQHISDAVSHIMCHKGYDVINIDDVIGIIIPSKLYQFFTILQENLIYLGFELSYKKMVSPTTNLNCLGIMVDTTTFTTSISYKKCLTCVVYGRIETNVINTTFSHCYTASFMFQNVSIILGFSLIECWNFSEIFQKEVL